MTGARICQNCKQNFIIEPEDFQFYKQLDVPPPTWCPDCRFKQRLLFRNENSLHKRNCDLCKKEIISVYSPSVSFPVYCQSCWYSDKWDPCNYGKPWNSTKTFFAQLLELQHRVPHEAIQGYNNINSEYSNAVNSKNIYLSSVIIESDTVLYSRYAIQCRDCISCFNLTKCEACIRISRSAFCSRCIDGELLENCHDTYFTSYSKGCSYCYGCINLRQKQYHIFNRPYSKNEYERRLSELLKLAYLDQKKLVDDFTITQMRRGVIHERSVDVEGQEIYFSKNCRHSSMMNFVSDSAYCFEVTSFSRNNQTVYNLYDCTIVGDIAIGYEMVGGGRSSRIKFGVITDDCMNLEYCMYCYGCENLFGCIGMRQKKYCILNQPYSKDEYIKTKDEIIKSMLKNEEYGKFFPKEFSVFNFNETLRWEFFPLSQELATNQGYRWNPSARTQYKITLIKDKIPSSVDNVSESITKEIIECEHEGNCNENCTKAFRIHPFEFQLIRKLKANLPKLCPSCRFAKHLRNTPIFTAEVRQCQCAGEKSENNVYKNFSSHIHHGNNRCLNKFESVYSSTRPEIIYCEDCYQQEVV